VVQGLTEFLPVSSSGHLILARAFFGWDLGRYGLAFDVACHAGTLLAVVVFFRRDVVAMLAALPNAIAGKAGDYEQLVRLVAIGTVPAILIAGLLGGVLEGLRSPGVVAVTLALGAAGLLVAERVGRANRGEDSIGYGEALAIGVAQAAALVPGVSRSGATLTVAMLLNVRRQGAARFVFLLSLPAVLAAAAKEALDLAVIGVHAVPVTLLAVGFVVSAVVGYLTVTLLLRYLANHSLAVFAYYRLALAALTVAWMVTR
jgi:undecaprenyl-diphosphatase